jgi:hypothetical protein
MISLKHTNPQEAKPACHAVPQGVGIGTNTDYAYDGARKLITWVRSQLLEMKSGSSLGLHQWVATSQQTVAPSPPAP